MLYNLYNEGFVPGPSDTLDSFLKRVEFIKEALSSPEAFLKKAKIPYETITEITPYFISITTKKGLPFWFGAMTMICEFEGQKIPIIELPNKPRGLSLTIDDLIAHERVHYLRSAFNEPRFEELLAYRTSRSKWRKYLGPIFQSPWESYLSLGLMLLPLFFFQLILITLTFLISLFIRLIINQHVLKKALKNLSLHYTNSEELILLFTDTEILKAAQNKFDQIDKTSPRLELLKQIASTKN
jgi:hypothetical protein